MLNVNIYDVSGRLINNASLNAREGLNTFQIDLVLLSTGLYTLEIVDTESEVFERLIFEKQE